MSEKSKQEIRSEIALAKQQGKPLPSDFFHHATDWFNASKPLLQELQGKLLILDFFTYCCINCMHLMPEMKKLEHEFANDPRVVFIGIHSAKFENERDTSNVYNCILKNDLQHIVVNDPMMNM